MPDLANLLLFATALALAAGSPGPSIAALTARVLTGGIGTVLPFLAAMWLGEAIWLICAVLGLAALAASFAPVFAVIKWAGVGYLLFLAWQMWRTDPEAEASLPRGKGGWGMFGAGLALTLGNPKIVVFYTALLPSLIEISAITPAGLAALVGVMLVVLIAVDLAWALAADRARRLLRSPRAMRAANRISATAMGGAAVAIATR